MNLVPDKIYSSKGAMADGFGISGLILALGVNVVKSNSNVVIIRMHYGNSKLLTIV